MKLLYLSFLVAGAGLLEASASPLRVVMISSGQSSANNVAVAQMMHTHSDGSKFRKIHVEASGGRRGCSQFRQKSVKLSNYFRHALGLPLIETHLKPTDDKKIHGGTIRIMPIIGTPILGEWKKTDDGLKTPGGDKVQIVKEIHHHRPHHRPMFAHRLQHESFLRRIHFALMALGPWEGRAVAFVLGCGIGVLLRMIWVLAIVTYRAIKGEREEDEYTPLAQQYDAEEIFVAPPIYTIDEKKPVPEDKKTAESD